EWDYKWNFSSTPNHPLTYGDLVEVDESVPAGSPLDGVPLASPRTWAYDSAGRVIAEARGAIDASSVSSPVRAFQYITPTTNSPAAVKTYTFVSDLAANFSYSFSTGVPTTDDSVQSIRYLDGLGRVVQARTRLGAGTAG